MASNRFDRFESIYALAAGAQGMSERYNSNEGHILLRPGTAIRGALSNVLANGSEDDITRLLGTDAVDELHVLREYYDERTALSKLGMHRFPVTPEFEDQHYAGAFVDVLTDELYVK